MSDEEIKEMARKLGSRGGKRKAELYDHEHYVQIGKLGGRPRIIKEKDGQTHLEDEELLDK